MSVREDIGYVPRAPRQGRPKPTDAEWLAAKFGKVETRDTGDDLCPWRVRLKRKDGRLVDFFGQTDTQALSRARAWAEAEEA